MDDDNEVSPTRSPSIEVHTGRSDGKVPGFREVFGGCCRLTKEFQVAGFDAEGIDWTGNKDRPVAKFQLLDLAAKWGQDRFWEMIGKGNVKVVTFAPPCGTASKAREKRRSVGVDPKPLRSEDFPDGLPGLRGAERERVEVANELYKFVATAIPRLNELGVVWIVENPLNSYMWRTSYFRPLMDDMDTFEGAVADMQMCMHGGGRPKRTRLFYRKLIDLSTMAIECDGSHVHLPWGLTKEGVFATAEERNYPVPFCKAIAKVCAETFKVEAAQKNQKVDDKGDKVAAGVQPRRVFDDLVPEFKVRRFLDRSQVESAKVKGGKVKVLGDQVFKVLDDSKEGAGNGSSSEQVEVGIFWNEVEFVEQSKKVIHPFDREVILPQRIAACVHFAAESGPKGVEEYRHRMLEWYRRRAAELEVEERALHAEMNPEVEKVVRDKRILLFKEMLADVCYDDMGVVDLLILGVRIMGKASATGVWQVDNTRAPMCPKETVWANARSAQRSALTPRKSIDEELDERVWEVTMEEVDSGLLVGPYTDVELGKVLGPRWVPARRFGLRQNDKVRPIDNFSEHLVNQCFGAEEKIAMMGVDQVVSWARAWIGACNDDRSVEVKDNTDQVWRCRLHEGWRLEQWRSLNGRVTDLANAYKQLPVHPADAGVSVIAVQQPSSERVHLYRALSLMFGETGAVYGFLRVSRALATLAARLFNLIVVEFFDDFTQLEPSLTASSALETMEGKNIW